jgi:tRNA dimethylallyltransferase
MAGRGVSGVATPLLALVGPTAAGKTEAGVAVAERLGAEIVSVDSMLVYRGMDVGTAKPTAEQRARVPHHLLDVAEPSEPFSVARFQELARAAIAGIRSRKRRVLLVGGSALYERAVVDELRFPGTDPDMRGGLEAEDCTSASPRPTPRRRRRSSRETSAASCGRSRSPS